MGRPKGSKNKPKTTDANSVKLEASKKRGRTPKDTSAMKVEAPKITKRTRKPKTPVISTETVEVDDGPAYSCQDNYLNPFQDYNHSFECKFEPVYEWGNIIPPKPDDKRQKFGNYSPCRVPVKPISKTLYPIIAYINVNIEQLRAQGYGDRDIYAGCINYLNRNQSKSKLKKLGTLMPYCFKILANGKISAMFLTDEKKSKMFWGEGE